MVTTLSRAGSRANTRTGSGSPRNATSSLRVTRSMSERQQRAIQRAYLRQMAQRKMKQKRTIVLRPSASASSASASSTGASSASASSTGASSASASSASASSTSASSASASSASASSTSASSTNNQQPIIHVVATPLDNILVDTNDTNSTNSINNDQCTTCGLPSALRKSHPNMSRIVDISVTNVSRDNNSDIRVCNTCGVQVIQAYASNSLKVLTQYLPTVDSRSSSCFAEFGHTSGVGSGMHKGFWPPLPDMQLTAQEEACIDELLTKSSSQLRNYIVNSNQLCAAVKYCHNAVMGYIRYIRDFSMPTPDYRDRMYELATFLHELWTCIADNQFEAGEQEAVREAMWWLTDTIVIMTPYNTLYSGTFDDPVQDFVCTLDPTFVSSLKTAKSPELRRRVDQFLHHLSGLNPRRQEFKGQAIFGPSLIGPPCANSNQQYHLVDASAIDIARFVTTDPEDRKVQEECKSVFEQFASSCLL